MAHHSVAKATCQRGAKALLLKKVYHKNSLVKSMKIYIIVAVVVAVAVSITVGNYLRKRRDRNE
jgi:hypothetical protein